MNFFKRKDLPYWLLSAFLIAAACYASNARADELYIGAWSKHFTGGEYNESHQLIGINYRNVVVARFDNSYNRDTILVGYDFRWHYRRLHAGVIAAVTHGYHECFGDNGNGPRFCATPVPYIGYDDLLAPKILFSHQMVAVTAAIQF